LQKQLKFWTWFGIDPGKSDDYWRGPFDQMGAAGIDVGKRKNGSKRSRALALANPEIAAKRMGALCRFKRLQEERNGNTR